MKALVATVLAILLVPSAASASVVPEEATDQGVWRKHATSGPRPERRSAPVAAAIGSGLYVFGGVTDDFSTGVNTFYNDLHRFSTRTNTWARLAPAGPVPAARAFAAGAALPGTGRFFVFGGSTFDATSLQVFDDLWAYSAAANRWERLASTTPGPSGRSGPAMWVVDDRLYVFGGIDGTFTTLNDLWVYDLRRAAWAQLRPEGVQPPTRHVPSTGDVARFGRLTLYGGEGDPSLGFPVLPDTWELDLARLRWREIPSTVTPERNYGVAGIVGSALYLQGGDIPGGSAGCGAPFPQNPTDELWRLDLERRVWQRLRPGGDPLARLKRHAAATIDGRMYVVNGWDFQCDGGVGPGQVWNNDVYSFRP